eukprot:2512941-Rhodomonas_salina.3
MLTLAPLSSGSSRREVSVGHGLVRSQSHPHSTLSNDLVSRGWRPASSSVSNPPTAWCSACTDPDLGTSRQFRPSPRLGARASRWAELTFVSAMSASLAR